MTSQPAAIPLNDNSDYGLCFACGPRNDGGLHLTFRREGDTVVTTYTGLEHHQGFPGVIHGAVITGLLDEVMSRVPVIEGRWGMSAKLDVRFRLPIRVGDVLTATARKDGGRGAIMRTSATVTLPDGRLAAEATATFALLSPNTLADMAQDYPELARTWLVG
ncbi:MAG: PaaI family thioesterase [Chloroflexi bacterium]|nr:PaaI family thioesterase [Chloroflexota bacterium]